MNFSNDKKQALAKIINHDKSKKGSIDKQISILINKINEHSDYYTTSSCAGRILIIKPSVLKKYDAEWLLSSHDEVNFDQVMNSLKELPKSDVWFRIEAPIIHLCAKDMDSADKFLKLANESGFRRSALLSFKKRIVIEVMIPQRMDVPISHEGKLIVDDDYIKVLIELANSKLNEARLKLDKLEKLF
jgi:tRNA wybutosine-synthesizing protein 3